MYFLEFLQGTHVQHQNGDMGREWHNIYHLALFTLQTWIVEIWFTFFLAGCKIEKRYVYKKYFDSYASYLKAQLRLIY